MPLDIRIQNNTISASHEPLTRLKPACRITQDTAAGAGTLSVDATYGFAVGQTVLIGNFGDPTSEIATLHASTVPTATALTLAATTTTAYDHYMDTPVTVIDYTQIEFSKAATVGGTKTVLATQNIQPNRMDTIFIDTADTTGYAFFRYKTAAGAFSSYSDPCPFATNPDNAMEILAEEGTSLAGVALGERYAGESQILRDINECQTTIAESRDWVFELASDETSVIFAQGQNSYPVSTLIANMKYPLGKQGIMRIMVGNLPLSYIEPEEMDGRYEYSFSSYLSQDCNIGDTSVYLVNSDSFPSTGTVDIGANVAVSYTANDTVNHILSGIPATGTGSIATAEAAGMLAIVGKPQATPQFYTFYNGNLLTDVPVDANSAGINAKIKYLIKIPALTSFS
jgi:hypothetical protein